MKPRDAARPGVVTSTTATVLLSALATSSVLPSGESASAFGVDPGGACGKSATPICSTARRAWRDRSTQTAFVLAHATNRRAPSLDSSIAFGCSPTCDRSPWLRAWPASNSRTLAPPQSDTNSVWPSADTSAEYGSASSGIVRSSFALATSTIESAVPSTCTANNRLPSGVTAIPPMNPESFRVSNVGRSAGLARTNCPGTSARRVPGELFTTFCAAPEANSRFPSGCHASPSQA